MPSGAKKRKAAKKKKENLNQSSNRSDSASVHPLGDENVKQQDDRESEAGDSSSPTSQDSRILPIEAESEVRRTSSTEGSRAGNGGEQAGVEESVVHVEKEIKIEDELGGKDGVTNHNEAERNSSYDGDSSRSSSSSSSSDDESHGIKKEQTVEAGDSVPSTTSVAPCVAESTLEENGAKKFASVGESACMSVNDAASYREEEASDVRSAESSPIVLDLKECVAQENDESHGIKKEQNVEAGDYTISVAPCVVESTLEENGGKKFTSVEESVCMSVNAASHGEEEEEANTVRSAESNLRIIDSKECVAQENDGSSTSPCTDSKAAINNGAQHVKDSVVTETPVTASPYPVQKTSWKSCCGLFEVFAGSAA